MAIDLFRSRATLEAEILVLRQQINVLRRTNARRLIRPISIANPLCGAPRIDGELLKLGIDVGQTSVAKYMARRRALPRRDGRRSFATMRMALSPWTSLSCRQSRSGCSMVC
jgi:hypothetical protein